MTVVRDLSSAGAAASKGRMPALFVSHGSPMFAVQPGLVGPQLHALGQALPRPRAVLVLSPHWITRDAIGVGAAPQPATIHDFGGFPDELYRLHYPAPGDPALARQVVGLLSAAGLPVTLDETQGLDHGVCVPLRHLYPQADVPVVPVSMPAWLAPDTARRLGQLLAPLADEGVLIVGSGSLTHNLREVFGQMGQNPPVAPYVTEFAGWIRERLRQGDVEAIVDYRRQAPAAARAHPTEEHFLALPFVLGAAEPRDGVEVLDGGVTDGFLSMDAYLVGGRCQTGSASAQAR